MNVLTTLKTTPALMLKITGDLEKADEDLRLLEVNAKHMQAAAAEEVRKIGKPEFPNEAAREAGIRARLSNDEKWKNLQARIRSQETFVRHIKATLQFHRDAQTNARVLALSRSPFDIVLDDPEVAPTGEPK